MSNELYPILPGQTIEISKTPAFSTKVQRAVSGRELRASFTSSPIWTYSLAYEFLRQGPTVTELQTLQGFFIARQGSWDSFLFDDPDDNQVVNDQFATGDGLASTFQLTRSLGGGAEPVANLKQMQLGGRMWNASGNTSMWPRRRAGSSIWTGAQDYSPAEYTISPSGSITFLRPPAAGQPIVWSGGYYYRCRFKDDQVEFRQFMSTFWEAKKVEFLACLGSKI